MELTYHRKGDYLFPNLTVEEEEVTIGKYGMLRRTFLKEHKNSLYQSLFLTGKLNSHLEQIEKAAQERMDSQMEKLLEKNPAPDKEADPMAWTAHMNALMATAESDKYLKAVSEVCCGGHPLSGKRWVCMERTSDVHYPG